MRSDVDVQLTLAARAEELASVRQMVRAIGRTLHVDHELETHMLLAVDEACANVVAHAYQPDQPDAVMHVRAHTQADEVVFVISDQGSPIVEGKQPGAGMGLRLIRHVSDQLVIEGPGEDGTRLTIHFRLPT
jgi:anti-sigma regulatory factor (Ser/Thr protein kinase)